MASTRRSRVWTDIEKNAIQSKRHERLELTIQIALADVARSVRTSSRVQRKHAAENIDVRQRSARMERESNTRL